ncbi:hypothetical protein [Nocardioides sp. L-11A]|uniref:hypothetical protein n=1 Tax=Nocardioides sp. L-11A TaxID=3043848 RepID=UPI002499FE18|nr:hypothetical protein QJ852_06420 [Nocardioides sp. L-11A]
MNIALNEVAAQAVTRRETGPTPVCSWCPTHDSTAGAPRVLVVWKHDVCRGQCWCGGAGHYTWSCQDHIEREVSDLTALGLVPVLTMTTIGADR